MTNSLGEQLAAAQCFKASEIEKEKVARMNDITTFTWKGARDKNHNQTEKKLIDMTEQELVKCYNHCMSMLYNDDKTNPGRYTLLEIIKDQRIRCNTELFLRHLENAYKPTENRRAIQRYMYLESINTFLRENADAFPADKNQIDITDITTNVPEEFCGIPVSYVIDGCLHRLGRFDKKHMTLTFITNKLGLWFTQEEMLEFTKEAKKLKSSDVAEARRQLVKERCNLLPSVNISIADTKVLNFKEFRALVQLKSKSYSEMTTDQLVVLREKGLFCLEEEVLKHAQQWEQRIDQIKKVAEYKGFKIGH